MKKFFIYVFMLIGLILSTPCLLFQIFRSIWMWDGIYADKFVDYIFDDLEEMTK